MSVAPDRPAPDILSEPERAALRAEAARQLIGVVGLALILATLALLAALWAATLLSTPALLAALLFGVAWLWLLGRSLARLRRVSQDLRGGHADAIEGAVIGEAGRSPGLIQIPRYRLHLGGRSFPVSRQRFLQIQPGTRYLARYGPRSGLLLDLTPLEPIPQPAPADPAPVAAIGELSRQEHELLRHIAAGLSNKEIAERMALSVNTIKMYSSQLYRKLGVSRRTEAVARARRDGLL